MGVRVGCSPRPPASGPDFGLPLESSFIIQASGGLMGPIRLALASR